MTPITPGPKEGPELSEEQVLAYLSRLQPEDANALLAKLPQAPLQTSMVPNPAKPAADGGRSRSSEATKEAMRAIASGNFALAQDLVSESDLCYLGEDGWGFLHWVVHAAGAAGAASLHTDEEHPVGCRCCHSASASARGPALALLQVLLNCQEGRLAVDVCTSQGSTPLMFAADAGDRDVCLDLLKARADLSLKDCDGDTAEAWALAKGHKSLAEILRTDS